MVISMSVAIPGHNDNCGQFTGGLHEREELGGLQERQEEARRQGRRQVHDAEVNAWSVLCKVSQITEVV